MFISSTAVIAQYLDRETQLAGVAKAETGGNGSVTGMARAVRRVTTGAIRAALEAGGVESTNGCNRGCGSDKLISGFFS